VQHSQNFQNSQIQIFQISQIFQNLKGSKFLKKNFVGLGFVFLKNLKSLKMVGS